jgi:hypothetical protein
MTEKLLFRVAKSFPLPGLGILLLPDMPPQALAAPALHTALPLTLRYPGGHTETTVATIEEIARAGCPTTRALLLTQPEAAPAPAGTEVWWNGAETNWEQLL